MRVGQTVSYKGTKWAVWGINYGMGYVFLYNLTSGKRARLVIVEK